MSRFGEKNDAAAQDAYTWRETLYTTLNQLASGLGLRVERTQVDIGDASVEGMPQQATQELAALGKQVGLSLSEAELQNAGDIFDIVQEGYPVLLAWPDRFAVLKRVTGNRFDVAIIGKQLAFEFWSRRQLRTVLNENRDLRILVARDELECSSLSSQADHGHRHHGHGNGHGHGDHHHEHATPWTRFLNLLWLDARDIWSIVLFALVAGVLALASPLAVESLVNVVSWGTYLQPLFVLALMLLVCLGLAGVLKILQTVVVEIIQRRLMVRIVSDLAHRFPRANLESIAGEFPRELANRVFDVLTIQKAMAVLLLDGISIVLTAGMGMVLLAAYHPFLLGFDLVLLFLMVSITWVLGRGGVRTAIAESITKYRIVHWLQDVLDSPTTFRTNGGEALAVDRASRLVAEYIDARKGQFRVVIRQVTFAIGLQVIASTALLGLGGWLVIQGQLTLGQLVASELVVTVVVGAFAKAGKSLEKLYDLLAGIDKVGHLLDIPVDPRHKQGAMPIGPAAVHWDDLNIHCGKASIATAAKTIAAGTRLAVRDDGRESKTLLLSAIVGLLKPSEGIVEIDGHDATRINTSGSENTLGYAGRLEVFRGTVRENVDLGRVAIGRGRVREALQEVGLWDDILRLEGGLDGNLQSGGYPLSRTQATLLMIARAIAIRPRLLVIDGLLDILSQQQLAWVWKTLGANDAPWTLVIATNRDDVAALCNEQLLLGEN